MGLKYFFDTYAVIEVVSGNPNYAKYVSEPVTLTVFNLAEIYWVVLNNLDEADANTVFEKYTDAVVEIDDETLKEAIKFRKKHKKNRLSYADCIGYIYAKQHGMRFLTGDKEFKDLENIEFMK